MKSNRANISFEHKNGERFTRAKTIGEEYTEERIRERIRTKEPVKQQPKVKTLHDLTADKFQQSAGLTHWGKIQNLKFTENRLKDLTELQKQLRIYGRTKELHTKFQQARNKDKFIRETEGAESDVMLHEAAKRYLSAYQKEHGKVPKSAELKPLLATLQKEKSALYEQYKIAKAEQMELAKLHMNLQKILGKERKQQEVDR